MRRQPRGPEATAAVPTRGTRGRIRWIPPRRRRWVAPLYRRPCHLLYGPTRPAGYPPHVLGGELAPLDTPPALLQTLCTLCGLYGRHRLAKAEARVGARARMREQPG